jgi:hypothetical protein
VQDSLRRPDGEGNVVLSAMRRQLEENAIASDDAGSLLENKEPVQKVRGYFAPLPLPGRPTHSCFLNCLLVDHGVSVVLLSDIRAP